METVKPLSQEQLIRVSFYCSVNLRDKILPSHIAEALDIFVKLPSAASAKYLLRTWTDSRVIFALALDDTHKDGFLKPKGSNKDPDYSKWKESTERNLRLSQVIQEFLFKSGLQNKMQVGFHKLRDQKVLIKRLNEIGKTKGFFENERQFLRDTVTKELDGYQITADLVCIHGIRDGSEVFFNGLGAKVDGQQYLESEVLFNISESTDDFINLVEEIINP